MSAPSTALTGVMHDRVARPPTWTVQAPHMPMPQPNLVPVRPISSRITHSSGVSSSTSIVTALPLMEKLLVIVGVLLAYRRDRALQIGPGRLARAGGAQIGGERAISASLKPVESWASPRPARHPWR
jgi:hypothetical protein